MTDLSTVFTMQTLVRRARVAVMKRQELKREARASLGLALESSDLFQKARNVLKMTLVDGMVPVSIPNNEEGDPLFTLQSFRPYIKIRVCRKSDRKSHDSWFHTSRWGRGPQPRWDEQVIIPEVATGDMVHLGVHNKVYEAGGEPHERCIGETRVRLTSLHFSLDIPREEHLIFEEVNSHDAG